MNLATNVAGLINSKPRKHENDQCKHFSSINKRGATKQRHIMKETKILYSYIIE